MSQTLLIADQDQDTARTLASELSADGYAVATATAIEALALQLIDRRPDLVVLGDFDGPGAQARLLGELRNGQAPFTPAVADTPAIVLSEHHGELAVLRAFDAGGDDFIAKPASYLELRARIRAVLARTGGRRTTPTLRVGALEIDTDLMRAHYDGHPIHLSRLEFALLAQLGEAPRRVWAKPELLKAIWGFENPTEAKTRTVDAHACRLRQKLHTAGARHLVVNRRGVGYALTTNTNNNGNNNGNGGGEAA